MCLSWKKFEFPKTVTEWISKIVWWGGKKKGSFLFSFIYFFYRAYNADCMKQGLIESNHSVKYLSLLFHSSLVFECGPQSCYHITEKQLKMKLMMFHYERRHTTQAALKRDPERSVWALCFDKCFYLRLERGSQWFTEMFDERRLL